MEPFDGPQGQTCPRLTWRPSPWGAFFAELDSALTEEVSLHCLGGFVVRVCYRLNLPTADVDIAEVIPKDQDVLLQLAGAGSKLHRKHSVYVEHLTLANLPDNYADRPLELFRQTYPRIPLFSLDPYALALSKIDRNSHVDPCHSNGLG